MVIHVFWQDYYGAGTVGTCDNLNDIPYLEKEFLSFNCIGPFKYVYKIMHRTTNYMFTGKTTEKKFLKFCTPKQDWHILIYEKTDSSQELPYALFKVSPSDFPICEPNDFYAYKNISANNETEFWATMQIYFRKKDNVFTAHIIRGHRSEDWDQ